MTTNCGHVYCKFCLKQWKAKCGGKDKYNCPNCRKAIKSESRNHYLENVINSLVDRFGENVKEQRNKLVQERKGKIFRKIFYFVHFSRIVVFLKPMKIALIMPTWSGINDPPQFVPTLLQSELPT